MFLSLRLKGLLDRPEESDGQALEGPVAQHLRAWAAYSGHDAGVCFWRTRAGTEVDFVVYGEAGLQAFDVRNSANSLSISELSALYLSSFALSSGSLACSQSQVRSKMLSKACLAAS